jgi:hypothetical protein
MLHTFITTRRASAGRQDDLLSVLLAVYRRRPAADPIGERGALDELHHRSTLLNAEHSSTTSPCERVLRAHLLFEQALWTHFPLGRQGSIWNAQ